MTQREGGKDKALRIDLNYYRHQTWIGLCRTAAIAIGFILSAVYGLWVLSRDPRGSATNGATPASHLSTGALAMVHAHFENNCQSCHSEELGVALARDAWQSDAEQRLKLQEVKCNACHNVEGHARSMLARPELDRDCARCHQEHGGRANVLSGVQSKNCTDCHADLSVACKANSPPHILPGIADFSTKSHGIVIASAEASDSKSMPQFRSLLKDRGRVRFDHAQHLQPGQVDATSRGGFQLDMLAPAVRDAYSKPGQRDDSLVQLDCNNCHAPYMVQDLAHSNAVAREEGRYYAPVDFDKHCAACHQISFAGQAANYLPLPHVAQREEFARLLSAKQIEGGLRGEVSEPRDRAATGSANSPTAQASKSVQLNDERVEAGVTAVFTRCRQCHFEADLEPDVIDRALAGTLASLIPGRWLQRGYFDHAAHARITRCAYCHQIPSGSGEPSDQQTVMIRGPESCVPCHREVDAPVPPELATESQRLEILGRKDQPTWSSGDCIKCHRYHWSRPEPPEDRTIAVSR